MKFKSGDWSPEFKKGDRIRTKSCTCKYCGFGARPHTGTVLGRNMNARGRFLVMLDEVTWQCSLDQNTIEKLNTLDLLAEAV